MLLLLPMPLIWGERCGEARRRTRCTPWTIAWRIVFDSIGLFYGVIVFCLTRSQQSHLLSSPGRTSEAHHTYHCPLSPCRYDSARHTQFNLPTNRILSSRFSAFQVTWKSAHSCVCLFIGIRLPLSLLSAFFFVFFFSHTACRWWWMMWCGNTHKRNVCVYRNYDFIFEMNWASSKRQSERTGEHVSVCTTMRLCEWRGDETDDIIVVIMR